MSADAGADVGEKLQGSVGVLVRVRGLGVYRRWFRRRGEVEKLRSSVRVSGRAAVASLEGGGARRHWR